MKYVTTSAFVLSLALLLPACDPIERKESLNPTFGNAVRHNMNVQIVNPDAGTKPAGPTEMNGTRAASAYDRYTKGTTEAPEAESVGGSGSSGSGGSK